jgi:hypothetical protein
MSTSLMRLDAPQVHPISVIRCVLGWSMLCMVNFVTVVANIMDGLRGFLSQIK